MCKYQIKNYILCGVLSFLKGNSSKRSKLEQPLLIIMLLIIIHMLINLDLNISLIPIILRLTYEIPCCSPRKVSPTEFQLAWKFRENTFKLIDLSSLRNTFWNIYFFSNKYSEKWISKWIEFDCYCIIICYLQNMTGNLVIFIIAIFANVLLFCFKLAWQE